MIFDTPPTGLTLRVMALPHIALIWVNKLIEVRRKILDKRRTIENIQGERKFMVDGEEYELPSREREDPVMKELLAYKEEIEFVRDIITNRDRTSVVAVMNAEMLPLYETERAHESLKKFKIPFNLVVVNKIIEFEEEVSKIKVRMDTQKKVLGEIHKKFRDVDIVKVPMFEEEPRGLKWLERIGGLIIGD